MQTLLIGRYDFGGLGVSEKKALKMDFECTDSQ
jgi:hypothetical protein